MRHGFVAPSSQQISLNSNNNNNNNNNNIINININININNINTPQGFSLTQGTTLASRVTRVPATSTWQFSGQVYTGHYVEGEKDRTIGENARLDPQTHSMVDCYGKLVGTYTMDGNNY